MKIKVNKLFDYEPAFNMYIVDFIREAGKTEAVTITEDGSIEVWNIEDLKVDFKDFLEFKHY